MSVGTPTQEEPKKVTVATAFKWCQEAREILAMKLIDGDRTKLDVAAKAGKENLEKLEELTFGTLTDEMQKLQQKYVKLAWDMQITGREFAQQEMQLKDLKNKTPTFGITKDQKARKKLWEASIKQAEQHIESLRQKIKDYTTEMQVVSGELGTEVEKKKRERENSKGKLKGKTAEIKIVKEAEELLKTGLGYVSDFSAYDTESAKVIKEAYAPFQKLDWYAASDRAAQRDKLRELNTKWNMSKNAYEAGKKIYNDNKIEARRLIVEIEEMLPEKDRKDLINDYYLGQDAALRYQWNVAGAKVNPLFIRNLTSRLNSVRNDYTTWVTTRTDGYKDIKGQLADITDGGMMNLALAPVADVIATTERTKDYSKGNTDFATAKADALKVLAAFNLIKAALERFSTLRTSVTSTVESLTGQNQAFAQPLLEKFEKALADFMKEKNVSTDDAAKKVIQKYDLILGDLVTKITDCTDDTLVAAMQEEIDLAKDCGKFIQPLTGKIKIAKDAVLIYEGLDFDPTTDKPIITGWKKTIADAEVLLAKLVKADKDKDSSEYNTLKSEYEAQLTLLDSVDMTAKSMTTTAENAVPTEQQKLTAQLKLLSAALFTTRLKTFREAKWHALASAEFEELEAAAESESIGVLREKLARATALTQEAQEALAYYQERGPLTTTVYGDLKDQLSALFKAINDKEVKKTLKQDHGALLNRLLEAKDGLSKDGPGTMSKNATKWQNLLTSELVPAKNELLNKVRLVKSRRELLTGQANQVIADIEGKLLPAIFTATGDMLSATSIPLYQQAKELLQQVSVGESLEALKLAEKKIANLAEELEFAIEDVASGTNTELLEDSKKNAAAEKKKFEAEQELKLRYQETLALYKPLYEKMAKLDRIDKTELSRIDSLYTEAAKTFKKGDLGGAKRSMVLAYQLLVQLEADPLASQTTERGKNHLKELNPRWTNSIKTLVDSLGNLESKIEESGKGATEYDSAAIAGKFKTKIVNTISGELDPTAFQQELLVLASESPKSNSPKYAKDLAKKRKLREQALAKLRRYREIVQKNPVYRGVITENNPWSREGGAVMGLPLLRAINDLDLNLQRAVE